MPFLLYNKPYVFIVYSYYNLLVLPFVVGDDLPLPPRPPPPHPSPPHPAPPAPPPPPYDERQEAIDILKKQGYDMVPVVSCVALLPIL